MKHLILILILVIVGCSSSRMVDSYKSQAISPDLEKILVIGITSHIQGQQVFEEAMEKAFRQKGIKAVQGTQEFDPDFIAREKTREEMDELEQQLREKDFDAILITRVNDVESLTSLGQSYHSFRRMFNDFEEDPYHDQLFYSTGDDREKYTIYHTVTSIYKITGEPGGELLWQAHIDLTDPQRIKPAVKQYVRLLMSALEKDKMISGN